MKRIAIITFGLLLCVSCGIKTNLDIQEAIFPPEHSIIVYQDATSQGFTDRSTVSLLGLGDAGYSVWEELHIENRGREMIEFNTPPILSNTASFEIDESSFKNELQAYERTSFKVRYQISDVGNVDSDITINYTVAKRKRSFKLTLRGNFTGVQVVEYIPEDTNTSTPAIERIVSNGGAGVDFGYKKDDQVTTTFRIKNNSNERLLINSVELDNNAINAGFQFASVLGNSFYIPKNDCKEFKLIFPKERMDKYREGNVIIRHDRSSLPYKVAVCGGGQIMPIEVEQQRGSQYVSCVLSYKYDKKCYDFGYKSGVSDPQHIFIKNSGRSVLRFKNIDIPDNAGSAFSIQKKYQAEALIYPQERAEIQVKFTPQTDKWSEEDLVIKDNNTGRKYILSFTGSAFKQPKDIPGLALWLRADMIGSEHVRDSKVEIFPDFGGHDLDAKNYKGKGPTYKKNGIGLWPDDKKLPMLNFSDNEAMAVVTPEGKWITENAEGTTSFVIFRPKLNEKRYHTQVAVVGSNGTKHVFPYIGTTQLTFDPKDGLTKNGSGDPRKSVRFYIENGYMSGGRSPASSMIYNIDNEDNPLYAAAIRFDNSINTPYPNFHFFVNGDKSNTGETPIAYINSADHGSPTGNIRAYGYPVGHLGVLRNYALDPNPSGACLMDYALSLSQNHPFFSSRTSTGSSFNGSIKNLYIGKHADETSPFYGDIAEVIIFNRTLTDDEIKDIYNYIKVRYNTQRLPEDFYKLYKVHPAAIPWIQKTY